MAIGARRRDAVIESQINPAQAVVANRAFCLVVFGGRCMAGSTIRSEGMHEIPDTFGRVAGRTIGAIMCAGRFVAGYAAAAIRVRITGDPVQGVVAGGALTVEVIARAVLPVTLLAARHIHMVIEHLVPIFHITVAGAAVFKIMIWRCLSFMAHQAVAAGLMIEGCLLIPAGHTFVA